MRGRDLILRAGGFKMSLTAQVQALFAGRAGGMWDMGDIATLYKADDGSVSVSGNGDTIGMVLDKSNGAIRGSEILTNGSFDADVSWTKGTSTTISGGVAALTSQAAGLCVEQGGFAFSVGQWLEISLTIVAYSAGSVSLRIGNNTLNSIFVPSANGTYRYIFKVANVVTQTFSVFCGTTTTLNIENVSVKSLPGNHATQSTAINRPLYQVVSSYGCAQFDATDDALLFPAITFGGAFNTFVAGKVTGATRGIHIWRTADTAGGWWALYQTADALSPTGAGAGTPSYFINGSALSPFQRGQIYTQINNIDSVVESIGVTLTVETALQFSGYPTVPFVGNAHRILMISGTLTAGEKLLCRRWCAEGNGVTVV